MKRISGRGRKSGTENTFYSYLCHPLKKSEKVLDWRNQKHEIGYNNENELSERDIDTEKNEFESFFYRGGICDHSDYFFCDCFWLAGCHGSVSGNTKFVKRIDKTGNSGTGKGYAGIGQDLERIKK